MSEPRHFLSFASTASDDDRLGRIEAAIEQILTSVGANRPGSVGKPVEQYVTLLQCASLMERSKRALTKHKGMPPPAIKGHRGQASRWFWHQIRPWLEAEFFCQLPEQFPTLWQE